MYKKKVLTIVSVAVIAVFTAHGVYQSQEKSRFNDLMIANVEALANNDETGSNCDNFNGYRRISEGSDRVYDCCYQERTGRGKEDCKRW